MNDAIDISSLLSRLASQVEPPCPAWQPAFIGMFSVKQSSLRGGAMDKTERFRAECVLLSPRGTPTSLS
jgi:hypothetical protein